MVLVLDGNWSRARHLVERSGNESGKRQSQAAARVSLQRAVSFPMWLWSQRLGVFRASEIDDEPNADHKREFVVVILPVQYSAIGTLSA